MQACEKFLKNINHFFKIFFLKFLINSPDLSEIFFNTFPKFYINVF